MSSSPEVYCLGGLIKDLDKEFIPEELDNDISKDETSYKSSKEQKFPSTDSAFSYPYDFNLFSPSLNKFSLYSDPQLILDKSVIFSRNNILNSFNSQKSTKILQKSLVDAPKEMIDNILDELSGNFRTIIKNKNGNYFCSDLLKFCNKEQKIKILKELSENISKDCTDEFATHPIQNLIELALDEEEYKLLLVSFNDMDSVLMASLNKNGSYVIQKLIVHIPERFRMEFNSIFVKFVCILSRDMYGVCAVKKFIGYTKNELIVKQILNSILTNFVNISANQYGNYLIQYLLEKWWKTGEGVYLKKIITSKFQILASNHFSSYICDLFLKLCSSEEKRNLVDSLNNYKTIGKNNLKSRIPLYLNKINKDLAEKRNQLKKLRKIKNKIKIYK
jgi:hypothetical protein